MSPAEQDRLDRLAARVTGRPRWIPADAPAKATFSPGPAQARDLTARPTNAILAAIAAELALQTDALTAIALSISIIADHIERTDTP